MTKIYFLDGIPQNIEILDQKNCKIFPLNFKVEKYLISKKIIPTDTSNWVNWEDFMFVDTTAIDIPMKWGLMKHLQKNMICILKDTNLPKINCYQQFYIVETYFVKMTFLLL